VKRSSEVLGATKVNDIAEIDGFENSRVQKNDPLGGEFNVLANFSLISLVQQYQLI
jgi:hypothetical protein